MAFSFLSLHLSLLPTISDWTRSIDADEVYCTVYLLYSTSVSLPLHEIVPVRYGDRHFAKMPAEEVGFEVSVVELRVGLGLGLCDGSSQS